MFLFVHVGPSVKKPMGMVTSPLSATRALTWQRHGAYVAQIKKVQRPLISLSQEFTFAGVYLVEVLKLLYYLRGHFG